jgi:ATP-dependent RNA helicase DDX60
MFVMLNDGGAGDADEKTTKALANSILVQRTRVFDFITTGFSCALLRGTTFRDSKVNLH